ncbi:hypothetical protein [Rhizobium viscosum]|uniref:Uncharacterized protein n=1 Tax=Rhizobium viscosum TaxID=1673 RepID=A0ABR9IIV8_RHIVS|nr:hypothetical protein [Rhizobium viscosum]MBE1503114.1 hypothetical protein [Rhizobium viscosum]
MADLDAASVIPDITWLGLDASRSLLTARRWIKGLAGLDAVSFILNDNLNIGNLYNKNKALDIAGAASDSSIACKLTITHATKWCNWKLIKAVG